MAETIKNGSTCLEQRGMEERQVEIARLNYTKENPYGATHPDAISDGDVNGKGTGTGGHTSYLPDCNKPKNFFDYSNFDTKRGGGYYDINGRNGIGGREKALASQLYNEFNQYGPALVNTSQNVAEGQIVLNY